MQRVDPPRDGSQRSEDVADVGRELAVRGELQVLLVGGLRLAVAAELLEGRALDEKCVGVLGIDDDGALGVGGGPRRVAAFEPGFDLGGLHGVAPKSNAD